MHSDRLSPPLGLSSFDNFPYSFFTFFFLFDYFSSSPMADQVAALLSFDKNRVYSRPSRQRSFQFFSFSFTGSQTFPQRINSLFSLSPKQSWLRYGYDLCERFTSGLVYSGKRCGKRRYMMQDISSSRALSVHPIRGEKCLILLLFSFFLSFFFKHGLLCQTRP
jgi:hypothetical protein